MKSTLNIIAIATILFILNSCGSTEEKGTEGTTTSEATATTLKSEKRDNYSPYAGDEIPRDVYFGDTHLHTSWSADAGMIGATLGPDEAYRIARGEEMMSYSGQPFKLVRPLDFIVVSDHAENLGLSDFIKRSDPIILANKKGKEWHDLVKSGNGYEAFLEWVRSDKEDLIKEPKMKESVWKKVVANAEKYYEPGKFTTFIGYEWTSMPGGSNLHRVVIYRDGADKTIDHLPFDMYDSVDPEDLWKNLAKYENETGGQVLAIPHNGNLSNGLMFDVETYSGKPLTKEYAEERIKWEPLYEVTQMKGDAEAHPYLSPDDEFADFETLDMGNLSGKMPKEKDMLAKEYGRSALKEGLRQEELLGVNPFKFGLIGSTDAHSAIPSAREENNFSKANIVEPSKDRFEHALVKGVTPELSIMVRDLGASGLAAVWAKENTREAIWDAMKRKEVYATTGTRLKVRVFGGWDFTASDLDNPNFAVYGYKNGVPMGADLVNANGKAPSFLIKALKDADGANIDRIQIIKCWLDVDGKTQEKIYDIAVSDNRVIDANGRCKTPVGSTINLKEATYDNSIGEPTMEAYWTDSDFDPNLKALYYVRVIEIPTPRWTAYDAVFYSIEMPEETVMTVQDRAYTSPIWYSPGK